ncbi:MAG: SRPBCC family protein [Byssovorax sp.]
MKLRVAILVGVLAGTGCGASAPAPPASAATAAGPRPPDAAPGSVFADSPSEDLIHVEREAVIYAPIDRLWAIFDDPRSYASILPFVRSVESPGKAANGALLISLNQGVAIANGSYTLRVFKVRPYEIELSIDHDFPSALREGRGHIELRREEESKTRVVYSMTVDLGDHWILHRFKDRIFKAITRPPYLLKIYAESHP